MDVPHSLCVLNQPVLYPVTGYWLFHPTICNCINQLCFLHKSAEYMTTKIGSVHIFFHSQWAQPRFEPRISGFEFDCFITELSCRWQVVLKTRPEWQEYLYLAVSCASNHTSLISTCSIFEYWKTNQFHFRCWQS